GDGFCLCEKVRDDAAIEIIRRANPETCCLVQHQGVVRHEEERAGILTGRTIESAKLTTLDLCDSLGSQVEHDLVMPLERVPEPREVQHDDASCHASGPFIHAPDPRSPLQGGSRCAPCSAPIRRPADERDRTDAAEVALRQVYAELGRRLAAVTSPRAVCYFERYWINCAQMQ